jgi:hypothetical protein
MIMAGMCVLAVIGFCAAPIGHTHAQLSDYRNVNHNTAHAAVWDAIPAACRARGFEHAKFIFGTTSHDVLRATGPDEIVVGLDGDDTIYAGSRDCVLGGSGDDHIYATADSIVVGGAGTDHCVAGPSSTESGCERTPARETDGPSTPSPASSSSPESNPSAPNPTKSPAPKSSSAPSSGPTSAPITSESAAAPTSATLTATQRAPGSAPSADSADSSSP